MTTQPIRPVGPRIGTLQSALVPSKDKVLRCDTITLRALGDWDADDLFPLLGGEQNAHIFTYMSDNPPTSSSQLTDMLTTKAASSDPLFYTIRLNATNKPVGWCALMRIDSTNRVLEIGHLLFSPVLQRTAAATEVLYLLLRYAFDELGYRRVEWKCDSLNAASRRAAARFGFVHEGTFRQHMVYKGRNRDTAWFSMLDGEWPERRQELEAWLADENFDAEGRQITKLEKFRESFRGEAQT